MNAPSTSVSLVCNPPLVIDAQAPIAHQPAETPLHDPPAWLDGEAMRP